MGLSAAAGRMEAVGKYLKAGMVKNRRRVAVIFAGKVRKTRRGCVSGGKMRRGAGTEGFFHLSRTVQR